MTERAQQRHAFLHAQQLTDATCHMVAGDASFRRYFRVTTADSSYILMDAPVEHEDVEPFMAIDRHLQSIGLHAPNIIAQDTDTGFLLLEDFGDGRYADVIAQADEDETRLYHRALDVLTHLHQAALPAAPLYDVETIQQELGLFTQWYLPQFFTEQHEQLSNRLWELWQPLLPHTQTDAPVLCLRDYHAENLMWLPEENGLHQVGLLDFQDALLGHPAYDVVSLLEDARRDVSTAYANQLRDYFLSQNPELDRQAFITSYAVLGVQRNLKIVGIFTRLAVRDNKPHYLKFLPRVWRYLTHDTHHYDILQPLGDWLDSAIPQSLREQVPSL